MVGTVEGDDTKSARTIAAEEINRLIEAADDEGGETLKNIGNLVDYVEKNAGEIAALITQANASTAKLADVDTTVGALIDSKIAAIPAYDLPMATISALGGVKSAKDDEDGKVAVNKVYVDQTTGVGEVRAFSTDNLVQGSMTLILNGGNADLGMVVKFTIDGAALTAPIASTWGEGVLEGIVVPGGDVITYNGNRLYLNGTAVKVGEAIVDGAAYTTAE